MVMAAKTYVVEDAEPDVSSCTPAATFPGTLAGLLYALDAARYRSAASEAGHHRKGQPTVAHPQVRGRPGGMVGINGGDPPAR